MWIVVESFVKALYHISLNVDLILQMIKKLPYFIYSFFTQEDNFFILIAREESITLSLISLVN